MVRQRLVLLIVIALAAVGLGAWAVRRAGGFSTRASPTGVERVIARAARRLAVPSGAREQRNPVPFGDDVWVEARAHFADHCAACHANDGSGRTETGEHLYPPAPDMRRPDTQRLSDGELYWIIENGVRLTGMPAWGAGGDNDVDTWKLVHFIRRLDRLTPDDLRQMQALNPRSPAELKEEEDDDRFLQGHDEQEAQ